MKKRSKICGITSSRLWAWLGLTAAAATLQPLAVQAAEYKIVIAQSITGPVSFIGGPVRDGLLMAIDEANKSGVLGAGNTVKAVVEDDASDRAQAMLLLSRHAADPSVLLYVGPTTGAIGGPAARAAQDLKIPMFTVTNSTEAHGAGPWAMTQAQGFNTGIPPIVTYAVEKKGVKNCSLVSISDSEAYVGQARLFAELLKARGVNILSEEKVKQSDSDFAALSVKLTTRAAQDCLVLVMPPAVGTNLLTQIRQAGLNPATHVFGISAFATPDFLRLGGAAVEGVTFNGDWLPGGNNDMGRTFVKNYRAAKGREPGNWEAMGYSAGQVVLAALKAAGPAPTRERVRDAMLKISKVPVVVGDGFFSFDERRYPRYGVVLLTVKDGKFVRAN